MAESTKKGRGTRPRGTRIDVWVTQEEREEIGERAAQANLSASAYLRTVGLTYPVPRLINREALGEFVRLSRELKEVGQLLKLWLDEKPGEGDVDVPLLMRSLSRIKGEMKDIAPRLLNERGPV
jgi:hypothetical protein